MCGDEKKSGGKHAPLQICCASFQHVFNLHGVTGWAGFPSHDGDSNKNCRWRQLNLFERSRAHSSLAPFAIPHRLEKEAMAPTFGRLRGLVGNQTMNKEMH